MSDEAIYFNYAQKSIDTNPSIMDACKGNTVLKIKMRNQINGFLGVELFGGK